MAEKYTKLEVLYEHPAKGMDHCADCKHFEVLAPKHCEIVEGIIQPEDWCKKFEEKKMKKHPYSHSVVEHHKDGSHTVHHIHEKHGHHHDVPVREGDMKGAAGNHDAMMDHMMDHTSEMNPGEAAANAGPAPAAGAAPAAV